MERIATKKGGIGENMDSRVFRNMDLWKGVGWGREEEFNRRVGGKLTYCPCSEMQV